MLILVAKRLLIAGLVALSVSGISFGLTFVSGDPTYRLAGENASETDLALIRERYGFDKPIVVQYARWLGGVLRGDLGESFFFKLPVRDLIAQRLPVTATLGAFAIAFALLFSIPMGVIAAVWSPTWIDRLVLIITVIGQAIPTFWFGLILTVIFSVVFPVLPPSGSDTWKHFVMPVIALGYYGSPPLMRLTRAGMLDVLSSDYIRTARAKGLSPGTVLFKHALRNAIMPVVSLAAVQFGYMLTGSVVIETVFSLNGIGLLAWESLSRSDIPTIQAILLIFSLLYVVLTLAADLLNA